jgi:hypothetical protein
MVVTFFWLKNLQTVQLCGRADYRETRKNLDSRMQLDEPVECAPRGNPLLLYKILHLMFFPLI